jgi:hypothetical protein
MNSLRGRATQLGSPFLPDPVGLSPWSSERAEALEAGEEGSMEAVVSDMWKAGS